MVPHSLSGLGQKGLNVIPCRLDGMPFALEGTDLAFEGSQGRALLVPAPFEPFHRCSETVLLGVLFDQAALVGSRIMSASPCIDGSIQIGKWDQDVSFMSR